MCLGTTMNKHVCTVYKDHFTQEVDIRKIHTLNVRMDIVTTIKHYQRTYFLQFLIEL